jgi:RimJ/RimL family protein N-acetyltransferase
LSLVEVTDDDFAAMLNGEATIRPGLVQPPGGVDQPHILAHLRQIVSRLQSAGYSRRNWMMVVDGEVVGLCGFKAPPANDGEIELGYGVAESRRRRGYATAAVGAIVEIARRDPSVHAILALTAIANLPSHRVLEDNDFARDGHRADPDDEEVIVWRRRFSR